jgi:LuxR family transcriptional regulator, maltose regulon positive regulatory protein
MSSVAQMLLPSEANELVPHARLRSPAVGSASASFQFPSPPSPDVTRQICRAIIRARSALAQTRIDEAARATLQVNRLIEKSLPGIPAAYLAALRLLQASLLAAEDQFADARTVLLSAPAAAAENPIFATILRYIDWKSQRLESAVARDVLDYLDPAVGGKTIHGIFGLCVSAAVEFDCLRPTVAANLAAEALSLARECYGNAASVTALPATLLAQVAYEQGRFQEAEVLLRQRLPAVRTCGLVECVARAFVLLARLAARRGEYRNALSILRDAEGIARARRWPRLLAVAASEQARTLAAGRENVSGHAAPFLREASEQIAADTMEEATRFEVDRRQQPRTPSLRTLESAQFLGSVAAPLDSGTSLRYSQLETALNRAAMAVSEGCVDDGYQILIPWLRIGAARGLCTVFSDAGPAVMGLLKNLYHRSDTLSASLSDLRPYLATLLKSAAPKNDRQSITSTYRPLSRRETGILELITRGMTNKRIAQNLGITPETVKTHAKSIFAKLESRTRAQAVARAEAIGLL